MGKRSVSRRRFLNAAGAGGSIALAAGQFSLPAAASEQASGASVTASLVDALGQYAGAGTAFSQAEATRIATLLAGPVSVVRGVTPPNYLNVAPASIFRVPTDK